MFTVWGGSTSRPTKNIDLLAHMDNAVEAVVAAMREICGLEVEPDGLSFDVGSVQGVAIKEDADYSGVRVTFLATLQNARVSMQIDTGFGDVVTPAAALTRYPVLLDFPAPELLAYPRETVVSEKFEAMTKLGLLNSRMKDFYDLWILSRQFSFDGATLATAIQNTFTNRKTSISSRIIALKREFGSDATKQSQWLGFLRKTRQPDAPTQLQAVIDDLVLFLAPVATALESKSTFDQRWVPCGPWRPNYTNNSLTD